MKVKLMFDGACDNKGNPPMMGIGLAVWVGQERREDLDKHFCGGVGTNNIAEYMALGAALHLARELAEKNFPDLLSMEFLIYGDSQLIVNQFNGKWDLKAEGLRKYYQYCRYLHNDIHKKYPGKCKIHVNWVRRELNTEADKLSKRGIMGEQKS